MQAEKAVQVENLLAGNVNARPHRVISSLGVRDDDVQSVRRAALKDDDQSPGPASGFDRAQSCTRQKTRDRGRADHGQSAVAQEYAAGDGHAHSSSRFSRELSALSFPVCSESLKG